MSYIYYAKAVKCLCEDCMSKRNTSRCKFQNKVFCNDYLGVIATLALFNKDACKRVPDELLAMALHDRGYIGELRKTTTVIV